MNGTGKGRRPAAYALAIAAASLLLAPVLQAQSPQETREELQRLEQRIEELERELDAAEAQESTPAQDEIIQRKVEEYIEAREEPGIEVGGAVRFQYAYRDFRDSDADRSVLELDTIRFNFDGTVSDVILSAELRYYEYMQVVHHAWVGYQFDPAWQGQAGIMRVPFGVLPYNSHNFFFSSNYYLGLEDDYDAGLQALYASGPWDLRLAFFLNDEQGGVNGFRGRAERNERYSYDVVGAGPLGPDGGLTNELAEENTFNGRLAYKLDYGGDSATEIGFSAMYGDLQGAGAAGSVGSHEAYAVHAVGDYGRWNLQLQATQYEYDTDLGAELMQVGAYAFNDLIPTEGTTYTANVAYKLPVAVGPVTSLLIYSDNSLITGKSGGLDDTRMHVLGTAIAAGAVYTYVDWVIAENQPFIGGSIGAGGGDVNHRFNINVGYYF